MELIRALKWNYLGAVQIEDKSVLVSVTTFEEHSLMNVALIVVHFTSNTFAQLFLIIVPRLKAHFQ